MRRRHSGMLLFLLGLLLGGTLALAADRPADALLRIAPEDASLTISVENLTERRQAFLGSPLGEALQTLPSYQRWRASAGFARFLKAKKEIEQALGTDLRTAADDLLGDAVVLVLRVEPGGATDDPRGLLLLKFQNEATVKKLIDSLNQGERQAGTLVGLETRKQGNQPYTLRRFAKGTKPDEAYAILPGNVFVWANSEALVTGVLDRQDRDSGLLANADFASVRSGLPAQAVASVYVSGHFLRLIPTEAPEDAEAGQRVILKAIRQYLDSVRYAGMSLRFDDDVRLDTLERRSVDELGPIAKTALPPGSGFEELLSRIPTDSIAVAAGRLDLDAVKQAVFLWMNAEQRQRASHLLETLSGFTLGRSLSDEVLPALGPGAVGVLAPPRSGRAHPGRPLLLFGLEFRGGEPMARALENGVRSAFTLAALDPRRGGESRNLGSRTIDGQPLVTLNGADTILAAGVSPSVLALGNQPESVAGFLSDPEPSADSPEPMALRDRTARFPEADVFLHVDLNAAYRLGTRLQTWLVRSVSADRGGDEASARRDVEQVLGLMRLFRAGYLTRSVSDDLETVRHSLVLVPRDDLRAAE
ncbi:MAG TPA: hypothetical protein VFT74_21185 [Isosphaeraceae bacterium]|nr:hypothetical protein [Isosphaeraceae bacterium]